jgi:septal ring factor EnvC (AmiA/AmiB activator)
MPPYYYDTCTYVVGYSLSMLFLTSFMASLGSVCAMYYMDVHPRVKQIVDLQNNLELFEGELATVRDETDEEYTRRRRAEADVEQLQNDLAIARAELQQAQEELHVSKHDNDIYAISVYLGMIAIALYGLYRLVGPFSTSDRTEL